MAQLLIIKAETVKDGLQYIGDVVGVFRDDHVFSSTELEKFDQIVIKGSIEDVRARLEQLKPRIETAYKWKDGVYYWKEPDIGPPVETINVYRMPETTRWYKLINDFKFPVNVGELTATEKQLLETVDITSASVDSYISKVVKDVAALTDNDVEVKELRNTEP